MIEIKITIDDKSNFPISINTGDKVIRIDNVEVKSTTTQQQESQAKVGRVIQIIDNALECLFKDNSFKSSTKKTMRRVINRWKDWITKNKLDNDLAAFSQESFNKFTKGHKDQKFSYTCRRIFNEYIRRKHDLPKLEIETQLSKPSEVKVDELGSIINKIRKIIDPKSKIYNVIPSYVEFNLYKNKSKRKLNLHKVINKRNLVKSMHNYLRTKDYKSSVDEYDYFADALGKISEVVPKKIIKFK